jgi:hypothetical protein
MTKVQIHGKITGRGLKSTCIKMKFLMFAGDHHLHACFCQLPSKVYEFAIKFVMWIGYNIVHDVTEEYVAAYRPIYSLYVNFMPGHEKARDTSVMQ